MRLSSLLLSGCTSAASLSVPDTVATGDTAAVSTADTGADLPCALDGAWVLDAYVCSDPELLDLEVGALQDCRFSIVATRHDPRVSSYPPLCLASEVVTLEEVGAGWNASSSEQTQNIDGCYGPAIEPLDMGAVTVLGPMLRSLEIHFSRAPWSLEACEDVTLVFSR